MSPCPSPDSGVWLITYVQRSIWVRSPTENAGFMDEYFRNSLVRDSDEMKRICAAVKEAGVFVVLGYSERYKNTLYIAQASTYVSEHD